MVIMLAVRRDLKRVVRVRIEIETVSRISVSDLGEINFRNINLGYVHGMHFTFYRQDSRPTMLNLRSEMNFCYESDNFQHDVYQSFCDCKNKLSASSVNFPSFTKPSMLSASTVNLSTCDLNSR